MEVDLTKGEVQKFFCIFTVVVVMGVYVFLKIHKLFNKKHIHFKELF